MALLLDFPARVSYQRRKMRCFENYDLFNAASKAFVIIIPLGYSSPSFLYYRRQSPAESPARLILKK